MKIHYLSDNWPWFDKHQCYSVLPHHVKKIFPGIRITSVSYSFFDKVLGKAHSIFSGDSGRRDSIFSAAEFKFFINSQFNPEDIYHVLFMDNHHHMLKRWKKAPSNFIGTFHHPVIRPLSSDARRNLSRLSSAIVLYKKAASFYRDEIGVENVKFIPHGVDTEFFSPVLLKNSPQNRHIFYAGRNGRNEAMFARLVKILSQKHKNLVFNILVPPNIRTNKNFYQIKNMANIIWHDNISESSLLDLYRKSYLLLMPMNDGGVNNAIIESLACGLPVVTTETEGIRDYGGGDVFPITANNDDKAMIEMVEHYLGDNRWRNDISGKCRRFAEDNLNWPMIAKKHLDAYKEIMEA